MASHTARHPHGLPGVQYAPHPRWQFPHPSTTVRTVWIMTISTLTDLIRSRRVIVTVGSGGVGKTTTAAAIALAGARAGRRVLCLTIDPARRLATSLGLREML